MLRRIKAMAIITLLMTVAQVGLPESFRVLYLPGDSFSDTPGQGGLDPALAADEGALDLAVALQVDGEPKGLTLDARDLAALFDFGDELVI